MSSPEHKLYWRPSGGAWHCFERADHLPNVNFSSLCGSVWLSFVGGQKCARPPVSKRCAECNVEESKIRGWEEGTGRVSPDWESYNNER